MLAGGGIECVGEFHVGVQGIVLGLDALLGVAVVEGHGDLGGGRQQFSEVQLGGDGVVEGVVVAAFADALLYASESGFLVVSLYVHAAEVRELYVQRCLRSPSSVVGEFLQTHLVGPHLYALDGASVVADTDHDGLHLSQRGVAHDGDLVAGPVAVELAELLIVAGVAEALLAVAVALELSELLEFDVDHVLCGPDDAAVRGVVLVVAPFGCQLQGYFVLVEVRLVVRAHAQEHAGLAVAQVGDVVGQGIGVDVELQVLVLPHVVVAVLEDGACVAGREVLGDEGQRLLVLLHELCLVGVRDACDSRRQDVVDGQFLVVLLDVDGSHLEACADGWCLPVVERLFVAAPVGLHEVECGKSEDDGFLESCEVDAYEPDAGEVRDASHGALVFLQGYSELEPTFRPLVAIAQGGDDASDVGDVVASDDGVLRVQADVVLEVFLVLVECEVLVDVLHVGRCLVGGLVALRRVVGVG